MEHPSSESGVWIQTQNSVFANHQGKELFPAASVTKVATTLAAINSFGPDHRFVTYFRYDGQVVDGVLNGDLLIVGSGDPFFIWEDAITVGNLIKQVGISSISGDLIISDNFYMNWQSDLLDSGSLFIKALNYKQWTSEVWTQYEAMASDIKKPEVMIRGGVKLLSTNRIEDYTSLIEHSSLPLAELLKRMNHYSNNPMADMIANAVGGAKQVEEIVVKATDVNPSEVSLINGSGLGDKNLMSPHAACLTLLALHKELKQHNLSLVDVMTVIGQDKSILDSRDLPGNSILKSGSLKNVSALTGVLPTEKKGLVWFSIMNRGFDLANFRKEQEDLLEDLRSEWGAADLPPEIFRSESLAEETSETKIVR